MKNKYYYHTFIVLILAISLVYILHLLQGRKSGVNVAQVYNSSEIMEEMALMENRIAGEKIKYVASSSTEREVITYKKLYPDLYTEYGTWKKRKRNEKIAYLTFDDGPSKNTYEVLDILKEHDIKATFFLVGNEITQKKEICLQRMKNEGHTIGIHTYSHLCNEIYCSVEQYLDDFNMVFQRIYDVTGVRANVFRFPWGSNNGYSKKIKDSLLNEMQRRGFRCYDWNVDTNDSFGRPSSYSIRHNVEKDLKRENHPIILMHDAASNRLTIQTLPDIIALLREKGYEFDTLKNREPYLFPW